MSVAVENGLDHATARDMLRGAAAFSGLFV